MDLLGTVRRLESTLARRFDRAARHAVGPVSREPLEIVHLILEAIDREIQPGGRGARMFPFNSITLSVVAASQEAQARFDAVVSQPPLLHRIVEYLASRSCPVDRLTVDIVYVAAAAEDWQDSQFQLAFARVSPAPRGDVPLARAVTRIDLTVMRGTADRKSYSFAASRIDLGRCAEVRDRRNRLLRTNQVAFIEGAEEINDSVSRLHAHIAYEPDSGGFRLRDDGSVHGTSLVRNGSTVAVPAGSRGVRLRSGDELVLGEARLRIRFDT